jgi:hypothetical protein
MKFKPNTLHALKSVEEEAQISRSIFVIVEGNQDDLANAFVDANLPKNVDALFVLILKGQSKT